MKPYVKKYYKGLLTDPKITYKARLGQDIVLRVSKEHMMTKYGFVTGERVKTIKGKGTVIGVGSLGEGSDCLWVHLDNERGASFWDNATSKSKLLGPLEFQNLNEKLDPEMSSTYTLIDSLADSLSYKDVPFFEEKVVADQLTTDEISLRNNLIYKYFKCPVCLQHKRGHKNKCQISVAKEITNEKDLLGEYEYCDICRTPIPIENIFQHVEICRIQQGLVLKLNLGTYGTHLPSELLNSIPSDQWGYSGITEPLELYVRCWGDIYEDKLSDISLYQVTLLKHNSMEEICRHPQVYFFNRKSKVHDLPNYMKNELYNFYFSREVVLMPSDIADILEYIHYFTTRDFSLKKQLIKELTSERSLIHAYKAASDNDKQGAMYLLSEGIYRVRDMFALWALPGFESLHSELKTKIAEEFSRGLKN